MSWCRIDSDSLLTAAEPARKWPIGKETNLYQLAGRDEGYIDYEAALNDRLGKGITPEKHANVLIWKALGSAGRRQGHAGGVFQAAGMESRR